METVCIGASLVRGELDYWAPTASRLIDGPLEHGGSETPASMARGDPYRFGLRSKCPTARQAWDERQLHGRNHFNAFGCDDEQLCGSVSITVNATS
jgi:hypothetical protein